MSVLTVELGQCGIQLGHDWFNTLAKDVGIVRDTSVPFPKGSNYVEAGVERWFTPTDKYNKYVARSILVDTEVKVIRSVFEKPSMEEWVYDPANVVCSNFGGSANNWACGYMNRAPALMELIKESIRREAEKCDRLQCFLLLFGTAGGTGSGIGCKLMEEFDSDYPSKYVVNTMILPYEGGEIITQNYNSLFTFAKAYDTADVHVILQNDFLHKMCTTLLKNDRVMLEDINALIADKLSFLHPIGNHSLQSVLGGLTSHPAYKMVTVKTAPYSAGLNALLRPTFDWDILVKHMVQSLRVSALTDENSMNWELKVPSLRKNMQHSIMKFITCSTNTLVTRGHQGRNPLDCRELQAHEIYPKWLTNDLKFHHYHENEKFLGKDKLISLITNSAFIHEPLKAIVEKAWLTFCEKAFVHHFEKYGLEQEDIALAFTTVDDILKNYKELN